MAHQKFKSSIFRKRTSDTLDNTTCSKNTFGSMKLQETLLMSLALFTAKASLTFDAVYKTRNKFQLACLNFSNKIQRARSWMLEESERLKKEAETS
ncbi:MAG: hypothetical protein ACOCPA_00290 [Segatella copri]